MTKISIITPTIGRPEILRLCQSIDNQTVKGKVEFEHIVVVDGPEYQEAVLQCTEPYKSIIKYFIVPVNCGTWGGPARAAGTMIASGDFTCFLDDDNWIEPNHFQALLNIAQTWKLDWCAAKRFVHCVNGFVLPKDPEFGYHIDGNCFIGKTDVVKKYAYLYAKVGFIQDRDFIAHLKRDYPLVVYPIETTVHYHTKWTQKTGEEFVRMRCE